MPPLWGRHAGRAPARGQWVHGHAAAKHITRGGTQLWGASVGYRTLIPILRQRGVRVLVLANREDRCAVEDALSAGALAYFEKNRPFDELLRFLVDTADSLAASSVSAARSADTPGRVSHIGSRHAAPSFDRLTPRERDVLASLMMGESAQAIANRRVVSLATVRTQISALLNKLEVNSQLAAVALAQTVGWRPHDGRASEDQRTSRL